MKEMLQLFRREAEHAPMERADVGKYDVSKPRVLRDVSREGSQGSQGSQVSVNVNANGVGASLGSQSQSQSRPSSSLISGGGLNGNGNVERRVSPPTTAFVPANKPAPAPVTNPASTNLGQSKGQMLEDDVYGRRW